MNETTICGTCGEPIWADARGARHKCKRTRLARIAAISAVAAAFSTMGALAIWPVPAAIPGAAAVYATCLFLTHRAWAPARTS